MKTLRALWSRGPGGFTRGSKDEREAGQGLAEYALILVFVALVCVLGLTALGTTIAGSPGFSLF